MFARPLPQHLRASPEKVLVLLPSSSKLLKTTRQFSQNRIRICSRAQRNNRQCTRERKARARTHIPLPFLPTAAVVAYLNYTIDIQMAIIKLIQNIYDQQHMRCSHLPSYGSPGVGQHLMLALPGHLPVTSDAPWHLCVVASRHCPSTPSLHPPLLPLFSVTCKGVFSPRLR